MGGGRSSCAQLDQCLSLVAVRGAGRGWGWTTCGPTPLVYIVANMHSVLGSIDCHHAAYGTGLTTSEWVRPAEQVCRTPDNRQSSLQRLSLLATARRRREFITLVGGVAAARLSRAHAQQRAMPTISWLYFGSVERCSGLPDHVEMLRPALLPFESSTLSAPTSCARPACGQTAAPTSEINSRRRILPSQLDTTKTPDHP